MDISDFIGVFPNALSDEHCDSLIQAYEDSNKLNYTTTRQKFENSTPIHKDNDMMFPAMRTTINDGVFYEHMQTEVKNFIESSWMCYSHYSSKYGILKSVNQHRFYPSIKIQKTPPTGGYHVWHCEHDTREHGSRLMLVMAYLNNVEEGGETEFLYQSRRIKPEKGTIVICPSGYTHTHRGNPPLTGDKYMINGWLEFEQ
jgi:hypothetical protein